MKQFLKRQHRRSRKQSRRWRQEHPRLYALLTVGGCLHWQRESIARGIAVGLFVGLTPTVGIQTLFILIGCIAVRGYFPAAFAVSWVSNPFTIVPMYWLFNAIGDFIFGHLLKPDLLLAPVLDNALREALLGLLGSLLIATPAAALGYTLAIRIGKRWSRERQLRKAARQQRAMVKAPGLT